jgi:hypothetical protein
MRTAPQGGCIPRVSAVSVAARVLSWLLAGFASMGAAEVPTLPHEREARFLGVETCGSSHCHGSAEPWRNATVLMRERLIWQEHDKHAKAYESLTADSGRQIAQKLGLGDPTQAHECLVCHTTFVPPTQQGPKFSYTAGVGCESCHGPGRAFLATHMQPTSRHASSVAAGMFPTTDPEARAALCLSCHQGDGVRRVSHRLYGAGHPRLRFELDTYSVLQPYHFNPDADYQRRKPHVSHFRLWAAGQVQAARNQLSIAAPGAAPAGLFPELAQFDCHACHQGINDDPAHRPRPGLRAGALPRNDAAFITLRALAQAADPAQVEPLVTATRAWQNATQDASRLEPAAATLTQAVNRLAATLARRAEQPGDPRAVVQALLAQSQHEAPLPFMAAENVAMSLSTLLTAEFEAGRLSAAQLKQANAALDTLYAAVGNEGTYRATAYASALGSVAAAIGLQ